MMVGLASPTPVEWEHGFKTDRVTATRYENKTMGYNIGFTFPKNAYDADRAELFDWFQTKNGWVYQGGGHPGAALYVKFDDVIDKESANKKLTVILPELDQLVADLAAGKKVVIVKPKPKYEWPDAPPPREGFWEGGPNINGVPYKKVEVSPGKWQYQVDQEAQDSLRKWESDKARLYADLRTRVLTDDELASAKSLGLSLVTQTMVSYYEHEKRRELDDAFLQQARLRATVCHADR